MPMGDMGHYGTVELHVHVNTLFLSLVHSCCVHDDALCCLTSGGGVMGSPGRLAALATLEDIQ